MSYNTYKSVKQLDDGTFKVVSASSNEYPKTYRSRVMDYYQRYTLLDNREKLFAWIITGLCCGDNHLDIVYKSLQNRVQDYLIERGIDPLEEARKDHEDYQMFVKQLAADIKDEVLHDYIVRDKKSGLYIVQQHKRTCSTAYSKSNAKIWRLTKSEIELKFSGYDFEFLEV